MYTCNWHSSIIQLLPRSQHLFSLWDIGAILYPCQYPIEQWCPIISILLATMRNMRLRPMQRKGRKENKGWMKQETLLVCSTLNRFIKKYLGRFSVCGSDVRCGWWFHHPITTNYNYPQLITPWVR